MPHPNEYTKEEIEIRALQIAREYKAKLLSWTIWINVRDDKTAYLGIMVRVGFNKRDQKKFGREYLEVWTNVRD